MKHLTKTLAVVSLLIPMSAQPLGIGELELHSALNQKLNAEIRLLLAPGENPADVKVRLAPPEKFDQAGVPWNYFLSKIKFQTVEQTNGSILIKVTSREPLTEPFLDFLLEVSWPQGSQFREFTALIDPPAEYRTPVTPATAFNNYQAGAYQDEYDRPVVKSRSNKKRITRSSEQPSNITPQTPSSGEYGPVQTNVTLWRIAEQLGNERNVATKQMLTALFHANPDAFNNGNIDSLKVGAILKIPETEAILQDGGKRTEPKPAQKEKTSVAKPELPVNKALELVAPTPEAKIADTAKIDGQIKPGQENIQAGDNIGSSGPTANGKDLELQSRIESLQQQLNMMQELLALKDQQLATLQGKDQTAGQPATDKAKTEPSPVPVPQPTVPNPTSEQEPTLPKVEPSVQPPVTATQPEVVKPAPAPVKPIPPKPTQVAAAEEEDLFSSPFYTIGIGGLSAGILGLLGWLLWRKRNIESQTNTESMFASASQIKMPDSDSNLSLPVIEMNSSTANYDVGTVGESSFISDFTPSDFEAFDTDQNEIDPLSEADVYLAYGRYQQAEDLIRHAITDHPDRDEYKLKLLEIFYANENKERFTDYAQELADAGKKNDYSFWNKVSDMGKEIIPESVLFGGSGVDLKPNKPEAVTEFAKPGQLADFNTDDDLELDLGLSNTDFIDLNSTTTPNTASEDGFDPEIAEWPLDASENDDNSLDFDLSLFSDTKNTQKPTEQNSTPLDIESIDFNFSHSDTGSADSTENSSSDTDDSLANFDFNFDLDSTEEDAASNQEKEATIQEPVDMASLESFEFPDFENDNVVDEFDQGPAKAQMISDKTPDEFDFNFNFDTPSSLGIDEEIDLGVSDLTDMDEFETKIDLAKAYIDMGDNQAAKSIAEEVLAKGTPAQKQAAQALLDELI